MFWFKIGMLSLMLDYGMWPTDLSFFEDGSLVCNLVI